MREVDRVWGAHPERKGSVAELLKRIRPVMRFTGMIRKKRSWEGKGDLHYLQEVDPFDVAFTWDPKAGPRVTDELVKLQDVRTYHTYGYYGFFKPSLSECIAQIPEELLDKVVAFEIVSSPETADDLNRESEALNDGYHVATTRLYGRA